MPNQTCADHGTPIKDQPADTSRALWSLVADLLAVQRQYIEQLETLAYRLERNAERLGELEARLHRGKGDK